MNLIMINGYKACITYDSDLDMFRGEFIGLNGGADFYADTVKDLHKEGENSLKLFLEECKKRGITSKKEYSGKLPLRISTELHAHLAETAASEGISINQFIQNTLEQHFHKNT